MTALHPPLLVPYALKDAPALIEKIFPVQKVSFEAQRERKAGQGQTLTGLGSYWKGRKPLILVRAIILGSLLPQTDDAEKDLELFEALMAFDTAGLGRRAVDQAAIKVADIARTVELDNPWDYFNFSIPSGSPLIEAAVEAWRFPLSDSQLDIRVSWIRGISDEQKAHVYAKALSLIPSYEARSLLCKRPEEVDQEFLYAPVWPVVNRRLGYLGVNVSSIQQLVEQLGILRYGHRTSVGDAFAGGGSIPFEAARIGCDVYASDLNPIACMLNWGNANIIGATPSVREDFDTSQTQLAEAVEREMVALGVEHDANGNRAKAYMYCLETRCPDTGWLVPLAPSWVISNKLNVCALLVPDYVNKRFHLRVVTGATRAQMHEAERGTVQGGFLAYSLDGQVHRTPIRTIRGEYKAKDGTLKNKLRQWEQHDFKPRPDDIFQERLYCIQWITADSINKSRQVTYFSGITEEDLVRERKVERIVEENIVAWQEQGILPNMSIEPGDKTDEPIRTRGWMYWHQLFSPRQLLLLALTKKHITHPGQLLSLCHMLNISSKLCMINSTAGQGGAVKYGDVFNNQALNTFLNYGVRGSMPLMKSGQLSPPSFPIQSEVKILNLAAREVACNSDMFITDPPYADAVQYHEIYEYFIAWLRKDPPAPFNEWTWDSRRALAIRGDGDDFRRGMIAAYTAMNNHMPNNGMQCVMFTHQSTDVWSDMVGIFWAAGLQVVAAWYIATETTSELKKGGYVQGTVTLMLKKRPPGEKVGFKQRILPAVRAEVKTQIEQMMHLNDDVESKMGEPVFNDSDLQMAGYAAALKVLTGYTHIGETDVTTFALRPRVRGEITVVDEIVQQASEAANSLLVPEGVSLDTWQAISGIQRFYLRMLDVESTGASKLDNYQNFAKAFRVQDYTRVMANMTANNACLTQPNEFSSRELTDSTEIGPTWLGALIISIQQVLKEVELRAVVFQLMEALPDFLEIRPKLIDIVTFLSYKMRDATVRSAAELLAARMQNQRALDQE